MPDKVEVANVAFRMIGSSTITSFDQGTKPANVVKDIYDEVLYGLLSSGNWKFATISVKLARSSTTPAWGYDYAYVLPSDWVRTVVVANNDKFAGNVVYEESQVGGQRVLLCDAEDVYIRYVKFEKDPNLMTPTFRRLLEISLARNMAVPIATSNTLEDQLRIKEKSALGKALSTDSIGSFPRERPKGSWVTSRYRRGTVQ